MIRYASIVSAILLLTVAAGCSPARRPEQNRPTHPPMTSPSTSGMELGPTGRGARYPSPRAGSAYDDPSMGVSTIASAVPGAGAVDAVVLGNVVLVGLTSQDGGVQRKVSEQIHASFPHIVEVRLTTDPAAIGRLRSVRQQIMSQQSISPSLPELATLSGAMRNAP